jgi:hypothetical protein
MLLGDGTLSSGDPNSLNLPPGQPVVLQNRNTEVSLTPGPVTAGTSTCAPGSLLTVSVAVRWTRGWADLALGDFALRALDGSVTHALAGCSSGFSEAPEELTVVFAAVQASRLAYGPDPEHPIAMWSLI